MALILVVDDDKAVVEVMAMVLQKNGYETLTAPGGIEALEILKEKEVDLVISDMRMGSMSGIDLLEEIRKVNTALPVVFITAYATLDTAMRANDMEAFDYIRKPFKIDKVLETVKAALDYGSKKKDSNNAFAGQGEAFYLEDIVTRCNVMKDACEMIKRCAPTDVPVLIRGEKGTGVELVAKTIHIFSERGEKPFLSLDCRKEAVVDLEKKLLGIENGKIVEGGMTQEAEGGTIFIQEFYQLPIELQNKMVTVLKEKHIPLGEDETAPVDVRFIVASTRDLQELLQTGKLEKPLFNAFQGLEVDLPPLRNRSEDVLPLLFHYVRRKSDDVDNMPSLDPAALQALEQYTWPGNVDELFEIVDGVLNALKGNRITLESLPVKITSAPRLVGADDPAQSKESLHKQHLKAYMQGEERKVLQSIVEEAGGDRKKAARLLNISLASLNHKLDDGE